MNNCPLPAVCRSSHTSVSSREGASGDQASHAMEHDYTMKLLMRFPERFPRSSSVVGVRFTVPPVPSPADFGRPRGSAGEGT